MQYCQEKIISLKNITKNFYLGGNKIAALKGTNLEICAGDFVLIYGPSGCGKTTLLNIVAGLERPSSGRVSLFGKYFYDFSEEERDTLRAENIGMVHQTAYWIRSLTTLENIILPLMIRGVSEEKARGYAYKTMQDLGISALADHLPSQLSGGQQQKTEIARALISNPSLILADEPTGDLDSISGNEIMEIFKKLNKDKKQTIIVVTHNQAYWNMGNVRIKMKDGLVIKYHHHE